MIRRVIFFSAALLCGSVSIANSSPATLVAGCTAGSCDALVIAEIAALGRLPAAQKDAQIDLLLAALASGAANKPGGEGCDQQSNRNDRRFLHIARAARGSRQSSGGVQSETGRDCSG